MKGLVTKAPGKLNLCLYLGSTRADGLHDLASLFESVSLHDTVTFVRRPEAANDSVICEQVDGENLALTALVKARAKGLLDGPPVELTIEKRIPVAAGMGGGSADAAAALRLIANEQGRDISDFVALAFELGADVPSQLTPGVAMVTGAGEYVNHLSDGQLANAPRAYLIVAQANGLSTAEVFRAADAKQLARPDVAALATSLKAKLDARPNTSALGAMVENDLTAAILGIRPELADITGRMITAGAIAAAVTGSGPTCFGLFADRGAAGQAAAEFVGDGQITHVAEPVGAEFAAVGQVQVVTG